MINYKIGITIRQCTSGLTNLLILIPLFGIIGGDGVGSGRLLVKDAFMDSSILFFVISGFFAVFAYSLWYKGNSMCGAALGMACNGMYSFWGPFFCFIILGIFFQMDGYSIPWQGWVRAVFMVAGIFVIAISQAAAAKEDTQAAKEKRQINMKLLNYAILKYFTKVDEAGADDVMLALKPEYGSFRGLKKAAVIDALMTAEQNGLLEEIRYDLDEKGELRVFYHAHDEGVATINKLYQGLK